VVGLVAAVLAGFALGLAPALLVLAGTALLGTIGFFWASLRTLSGDAPLPEGVAAHSLVSRTLAPERKRETLRALKDLEFEHSIGKIDDADYLELSTRYRAVAKSLMREMDETLAPRRERAEALVKSHLERKKLVPVETTVAVAEPEEAATESAPALASPRERVECGVCTASNEPDASFCKKCGSALGQPSRATEETPDAQV
jgi:hypothetical protein